MAFDPDAQYNQTIADLGLQSTWEESGITEKLQGTEARVGYQENELTRSEPGVYRGGSNAANKGGLLESGINARRKTDIAGNFAARRTGNQLTLTSARGGAQHEREGVGLRKIQGERGAGDRRNREKEQYAAEHPGPGPTYPDQTFPTPPGTYGQPGVGGVTPYESPNVRVGSTRGPSPRELEARRNAAAKRRR